MNYNEHEWFAVHTRHQHEGVVVSILALKGFHTFLPTYKEVRHWKDRKKVLSLPLFPGYVFATDARDRRIDLLSTPGVCGVLSVQGVPASIPAEEMEMVMRMVSCPESLQPHPFLKQGDFVKVKSGPLRGIEGILVGEKGKFRLVVSIEMMGRSASVEIDRHAIERVRPGVAYPQERPVLEPEFSSAQRPSA